MREKRTRPDGQVWFRDSSRSNRPSPAVVPTLVDSTSLRCLCLVTFAGVHRVLVLRHGASTWNAEGRWQGWLDAPLTAEGEEQAAARARELAHAGDPAPRHLHLRPRPGPPHRGDHRRPPRAPGHPGRRACASATAASGRDAPATRSRRAGRGCATRGAGASSPRRPAASRTPQLLDPRRRRDRRARSRTSAGARSSS